MKQRLLQIFDQVVAASAATKVTILSALLILGALVGFASWRASIPHFVLLESGLDATQASLLEAALANDGIRYEISQPPGPYVVRVDESEVYAARNAAALAGFRTPTPKGVNPGANGASNVFLAGSERAQMIAKRQWQEMEKQLEAFDFVSVANVQGQSQGSGLLRRPGEDTYSVVLQVRGSRQLTYGEGSIVAQIVAHGFGTSAENVVVTDQNGHMAWTGGADDSSIGGTKDIFRYKQEEDRYRTRVMQDYFDKVYGVGLVQALVTTEWSSDLVEKFSEKPGKGVTVSKTTEESSSPVGASSVGGVAGLGSNLQDFGNGNAGLPSGGSSQTASVNTPESKTKSSSERNAIGMELERRIANSPVLTRIDVAVTIDTSLADLKEDIEASANAMVPIDEGQRDSIGRVVVRVAKMADIMRDEEGNPLPPAAEEPLEGTDPILELALEYGIEALAAIAFLFILLRSLKGVRSTITEAAQVAVHKEPVATKVTVGEGGGLIATTDDGEAITDREVDLEAVARTQIEELLRSDPERISEILTRWASGESVKVGA
jgi:flagellar biosynthesis/type III secretory pathway M-ring protein FliF/YscJ